MKKLLSVVMLVCIVMSMCTVSAWAAPGTITLSGAWITYGGGREAYIIDIKADGTGVVANSELKILLLHNGNIISETVPVFGGDSDLSGYPIGATTCNIVADGKKSGSWNTTWFAPLSSTVKPDSYKIIADGTEYTNALDSEKGDGTSKFAAPTKPVVTMSNGIVVGYYNTLEEAVAAAPSGSNSDILIREAGNYVLPDGQGKNIVFTDTVSGVVIDMQNSNGNYGSVNFGGNITVHNRPATVNPPASNNPAPAAPAAPVVENVYYIPATDDNSNMVLWSILALALLSTAFVTRKRKSEN